MSEAYITNGNVAWPVGGKIGRFLRDKFYIPPEGWLVVICLKSQPWVHGDFGEMRKVNGNRNL